MSSHRIAIGSFPLFHTISSCLLISFVLLVWQSAEMDLWPGVEGFGTDMPIIIDQ